MIRWRGEPDPRHVKAVDAYWISAAEHGMNASTFTARVIASTGADVAAAMSGAVGALSGPLHGGAPARVLHMIEDVERTGDAEGYVKSAARPRERLMGFGHRVYRAEDPRARVLRRTAKELGAPRYEVALALENAALTELRAPPAGPRARDQRRVLGGDRAGLRPDPGARYSRRCSPAPGPRAGRRTSWSRSCTGRLVRPSARYIGPAPARSVTSQARQVLDRSVRSISARGRPPGRAAWVPVPIPPWPGPS